MVTFAVRPSVALIGVNAVILGIGAAGAGTAYALGVQSHTTNLISHGCPADPGCSVGDDYVRHGYNLDERFAGMTNSKVAVYYDPAGDGATFPNDYETGLIESSTIRTDVEFDTNPFDECSWATWHSVDSPVLNGHWHYTADAPVPCA